MGDVCRGAPAAVPAPPRAASTRVFPRNPRAGPLPTDTRMLESALPLTFRSREAFPLEREFVAHSGDNGLPESGGCAKLSDMKSKDRSFTQKLKDKLLTEMARQGLNGQRLAQRSRVSDSEISRILSGQSTPGLENAFRLARSVGVSLDFLADDALDIDPLKSTDPLSPDERQLLDPPQQIGMPRSIHLLENIRFLGYETALPRLLMAKPRVEMDLDDDARPVPPPAPPVNVNVMPT